MCGKLSLYNSALDNRFIVNRVRRAKHLLGAALLCMTTCIILVGNPSVFFNSMLTQIQANRLDLFWFLSSQLWLPQQSLDKFQTCSINNFLNTGLPFLEFASPLPVNEFVQRRNNLAKALVADQVDGFIAEPGYTFQYYANISQKDWEVWEPEERPFLMIVQPCKNSSTGEIRSSTSFLAPSFEVERVKLLHMPFEESLTIVPWEEHWNPYKTLKKSWKTYLTTESEPVLRITAPKVMVDEEMRDFIQRGLGENGFDVVGLGGEVQRVKQTKSPREVEILRAVNAGTVEAVRAMRECMYASLTENDIIEVLDNTLRAAGLEPFFDIVLFGRLTQM
jgi:Xaa-Pro aminopeptidase